MSAQTPEIIRLGTVESTMLEAASLAADGRPHGTAVVAEAQTGGIGRHGHSWHSEPGSGLYVSVVLRLPLGPTELPVLTLALGLATAEAITLSTGLVCDLRWPNDILIHRKKAAGILVQFSDGVVIAGIGVNVNHAKFSPHLQEEATSLRLASGAATDREQLLHNLLSAVESTSQILANNGKAAILKIFCDSSSFASGKRVRVDVGGRHIEGVTAGLDHSGFLLVRKLDGQIETVMAGGVRPA
ncbi:MAG: biotin--[acetyl-CoA-carboxylase] ligase [Acidobacteriota bacterium]|nr:biotin--[acetyl-CoA-carboxylase] ligase [Acidobacteriota bacterium]